MSSTTKLNGVRLGRMIIAGANELASNKQLVDAMNVFPVPDGDTGTNMSLTVMAAAREAEKNGSLQVADIAKAASGGALRGARGNSGVITSQIFRGFAKALEGMEEAGVQELAAAAEQAVKTAYKAVMKPKEGTILTVARGCAEAAVRLAEETDEIEEGHYRGRTQGSGADTRNAPCVEAGRRCGCRRQRIAVYSGGRTQAAGR